MPTPSCSLVRTTLLPRGVSALMLAVAATRPEHVRLLLDAGADPNQDRLRAREEPLLLNACRKMLGVIAMEGDDDEISIRPSSSSSSPSSSMSASMKLMQDAQTVYRLLLDAGADYNTSDSEGVTCLMLLSRAQRHAEIDDLMNRSAMALKQQQQQLYGSGASSKQTSRPSSSLMPTRPSTANRTGTASAELVSPKSSTAISLTAPRPFSQTPSRNELASPKAMSDSDAKRPPSSSGSVAYNSRPSSSSSKTLTASSNQQLQHQQPMRVYYLLEVHVPDSEGGATPLHAAAERGDLMLCVKLLNAGAQINHADKRGNTPLTLAAGMISLSCMILSPINIVCSHGFELISCLCCLTGSKFCLCTLNGF